MLVLFQTNLNLLLSNNLKKSDLDSYDLKNHPPNPPPPHLKFVVLVKAKIEHVIAARLLSHLSSHNLISNFQSLMQASDSDDSMFN